MSVGSLKIRNASLVSIFSLVLLLLAAWPAEAAELDDTVALCVSCHGETGMPAEPDMPILWGQEFYYIYVQLKDYKASRRYSEVMNDVVAEMSRADMKAVAQYFSEKAWPPTGFRSTVDDDTKGMTAANAGQCFQCHIGNYIGDSGVPRLAGQQLGYLERTMLEFKNKIRRNSQAKGSLFATFDDADIEALARYLAGI
jgi:cytochrome c553